MEKKTKKKQQKPVPLNIIKNPTPSSSAEKVFHHPFIPCSALNHPSIQAQLICVWMTRHVMSRMISPWSHHTYTHL